MKPCISEATTMACTFAEDVAAYADAGCTALEVWLTKLEDHLQKHSLAETRKLLQDRGMTLAAGSYQGGLLLSQGEQRRTHLDHFQRRLSICQELGIRTLVIVPDIAEQASGLVLEHGSKALKQIAQLAASYEVRLALEFQPAFRWCTSLDTAVALVEMCEEPNLGINFDVFHYYTGPSKFEDLALLNSKNLNFVQLSDIAGVPRELAADADRVLPGDGDFRLEPILEHLRRIGYEGWVSVELMNPEIWKMKPVQVAEAAMTCLRRLLGQAAMVQGAATSRPSPSKPS